MIEEHGPYGSRSTPLPQRQCACSPPAAPHKKAASPSRVGHVERTIGFDAPSPPALNGEPRQAAYRRMSVFAAFVGLRRIMIPQTERPGGRLVGAAGRRASRRSRKSLFCCPDGEQQSLTGPHFSPRAILTPSH
jgi:hypothetical protein